MSCDCRQEVFLSLYIKFGLLNFLHETWKKYHGICNSFLSISKFYQLFVFIQSFDWDYILN